MENSNQMVRTAVSAMSATDNQSSFSPFLSVSSTPHPLPTTVQGLIIISRSCFNFLIHFSTSIGRRRPMALIMIIVL